MHQSPVSDSHWLNLIRSLQARRSRKYSLQGSAPDLENRAGMEWEADLAAGRQVICATLFGNRPGSQESTG